ncbi:elongation factor P 5-aminopentanone reductase [Gracilibacillus kekensis]|uniref:3-oxoacyl-[acyl-carrier protein] reductase n=1 Tax=Gracilibacillus kekensis TaxID=1027249 RepID=A0A1M7PIM6_9BACI|nr:SDR family oxidoreductase [Gracilibacillus kekensis]SHN16964.1 3-oxoacyl-[acyl-carrier protein] reductase [Gracilibacillus kekensis]
MKKRTLITGASGEIGKAIAIQLAEQGHSLVLHYHQNRAAIDDILNHISAKQIIEVIQSNLSTPNGLDQFLEQLPSQLDHFIFTSGATYYGLFQDMDDKTLDEMLHLHLKAPWKISQRLIPNMIQQSFGRMVLITSIWGEIGASCEVAYSSVKGGQQAYIKSLAKELGPSNIYVNGVSPGFIDTKMNHTLTVEEKAELIQDIPLQRAGTPKDVAGAVQFLCSDSATYIQGEIIRVNGAWG